MGRAAQALKQVLETHNITQNQLAVAMGIRRSNVSRWIAGSRDPVAETLLDIRDALHRINPSAAVDFAELYWGTPGADRQNP